MPPPPRPPELRIPARLCLRLRRSLLSVLLLLRPLLLVAISLVKAAYEDKTTNSGAAFLLTCASGRS